jgi:hypothetical protein
MAKEANMPRTLSLFTTSAALALAMGVSAPAYAQTVSDSADAPPNPLLVPSQSDEGAESGEDAREQRSSRRERGRRGQRGQRGSSRAVVDVSPYIEVGQIVSAELTNGGDVLTYSTVAAGVDTTIATRRTQAQVSARYERRIGWGDDLSDQDVISGIARARTDIMSGFSLEGGALATRASIDGRGAGGGLFAGDRDNSADLYSFYVGPTFGRRIGDLEVGAAYRFGYTRAEVNQQVVLPSGARAIGSFEDSTNHALIGSVGMSPGTLGGLPVGWRLSGGADEVRSGQLDQRYRGRHARLDLTVPIDPTVALVGGVGYENIRLTQRAPLLDAVTGQPVIDPRGRLVSDTAQPRQIAFETDGLIWDAGVLWRPNRRTSIEGRIGRRYGSTTYTGAISWQASENTVFAASLYDNFTTVGRQLTNALAALPTNFDIFRNPIDGSLAGCAFGDEGGNCLGNSLNNLSGFGFRNRGVIASVSTQASVWSFGAAVGYDRRSYTTGAIAGLVDIDGIEDENLFAYLSASRPVGPNTNFASSIYASWFDSGFAGDFSSTTYGANAALSHSFSRRLSGTAATSLNVVDQDGFNTRVFASALLGLRYGF